MLSFLYLIVLLWLVIKGGVESCFEKMVGIRTLASFKTLEMFFFFFFESNVGASEGAHIDMSLTCP